MTMPRALAFVIREFEEMLPPTLFFAVGFNLIVLTTQLFLDDYQQQFFGFMIATTAALVVGKAVLLANAVPFLSFAALIERLCTSLFCLKRFSTSSLSF